MVHNAGVCFAAVLPYVRSERKEVLLISNSKLFGLEYLEHCADHIRSFLGPALQSYILFVPYALKDRDGYAAKAREAFERMGYQLRSLHEFQPRERAEGVCKASAVFVGGGNTFRLLSCLYADGVMPIIKDRVEAGQLKYIGSSAGTNVACPTIRNTNDMPIVCPPSFAGMCLVPFQINTHYIDKEREVKHHMGETRETRITEFTEDQGPRERGIEAQGGGGGIDPQSPSHRRSGPGCPTPPGDVSRTGRGHIPAPTTMHCRSQAPVFRGWTEPSPLTRRLENCPFSVLERAPQPSFSRLAPASFVPEVVFPEPRFAKVGSVHPRVSPPPPP
ncbi:unnamed protein product [Prorocentrum cordatum]|uniref:Dipeptidase E n=1 Tax=Prorocentrum cordatum TaxID=2364126 RepID=A0ABN9TMF7_9DINO|nr:unnamed protein product [Polarella glacialis]